MALTEEEVKQLNRDRLDEGNRSRAEAFLAVQKANESRAWYRFCVEHSGQKGLTTGDYFSCVANDNMLRGYISKMEPPTINEQNLEQAYQDCREVLARRPESQRPYERKTDLSVSRVVPQRFEPHPIKPAYAPFTRDEILSWDSARLHKEMAKGKQYVDTINAILAGN